MAAFGFVAIRYMKSPDFERDLKNKIMGNIDNVLPDAIKGQMPEYTAPPMAKPKISIPL